MNKDKLPVELNIVRTEKKNFTPSEKVKARIPQAEWLDDPTAWDEKRFIAETSEFMFETYGIGTDQDRHLLAMLADQITIYVKAKEGIKFDGIVAEFNNGKTRGASPYVSVMKDTLNKIVVLMNELGLTPKGRMAKTGNDNNSFSDLLAGVKVTKK